MLRPIERRVLRLSEAGVDDVEIAWRFRRTPRFVKQVRALARVPRAQRAGTSGELRPVERRVLKWIDAGASHGDLAPRFRRTPEFLEQVEELARYKLETRR